MKNKFLFSILITFCFTNLSNCERDDICLEGTPGTPNLIIRFYDAENINNPKPLRLLIQEMDDDKTDLSSYLIRFLIPGDSVSVPLSSSKDYTEYKLFNNWGTNISDPQIDTLRINHSRNDTYLNRACGFIGQYIFSENPIEGISSDKSWIKSYKIVKDSILNEESKHLILYH